MKTSLRIWLGRWQFPLFLLLSVMPIPLAWLCINAPDTLPFAYVLFGAYALLSGACLCVRGKHRLKAAFLSSALMLALSFMLLSIRAYPLFLLLPIGLSALLLYSLPLAARQYESEVPPYLYVVGIGIHIVFQFLHNYFARTGDVSPYEPASHALTASLVGFVILLLLSLNRISLDNAALVRHRLPESMRLFNTVLTLTFTFLCLLLASLPAVARAIYNLWLLLCGIVSRIIAWLISLLPSAVDPGFGSSGAAGGFPDFPMEMTPPSAFALIMQKIASILSMMLLAGGCLFLVYLLVRQLIRLGRHLSRRLRTYMAAAVSEYDDEITDTREDGAQRETRFTRSIRRRSAVWEATPSGRIRQSYAKLLRRRPKWTDSSTARENLSESAAALYERARYSRHPVTDEDAQRFCDEIRKA